MASLNAGTFVPSKDITLGEYLLDEWLVATSPPQVGYETWYDRKRNLEHHVIAHLGDVRLQDLKAVHLNKLYAHLLADGRVDGQGGLSATTVRRVHAILRKALNDAMRWGLLQRNVTGSADPPPARVVKAARKASMRIWTWQQLRTFLEATGDHPLHPLWMLAAMTGMRRSELVGVRWPNLDLDAGFVEVRDTVVLEEDGYALADDQNAHRMCTRQRRRGIRSGDSGTVAVHTVAVTSAQPRRRWTGRLAAGLGGLAVAEVLAAVGLTVSVGWLWRDALDAFVVTNSVMGVAFAVCGAIIAWHRPRNPIGWLLVADGIGHATAALTAPLVQALHDGGGPLGLQRALLTLFAYSWPWSIALFLPLALLLFPDGRPPSPRWRPVVIAVVATAPLFVLEMGAAPVPVDPDWPIGYLTISRYDVLQPLWTVSEIRTLGALVLAIAALVVRYRAAADIQRRQLQWLLFATTTAVAFTLPWTFLAGTPVVVLFAIPLIPAAVTVAILRYRLYDIDLVISKTLVFAGLAGFITAVYVGVVVGVGSLMGRGGEPNLVLSILATTAVAVAFQPARERLTRMANRLVYGRRASPYEVLSRFSSQLGETVATEQTLQQMARLLAEGTGAARAQVWLKAGERMRSAASWPADAVPDLAPVIDPNGSLPEFADVDLAVPVDHDGELLGALSVTKKRGEPVSPVERKLLEDLAAQAGLVVRNVRLTAELRKRLEELRDSRRRLVSAQDQERRRLERDLHDGAQQQLVGLKIKLSLARRLAERDGATQTGQMLDQLAGEADEAVATLRELAHGIYPPLLAAEGLAEALRARAAKAPIPIRVEADGVGRFSQEVEVAVYFCVLEAIQNAVKYAHASQVTVRLAERDGQLTFEVTDDGVGFDPATTPRGHGLTNMTDRLDALDATLTMASTPGHGTTIAGRFPAARPPTTAVTARRPSAHL